MSQDAEKLIITPAQCVVGTLSMASPIVHWVIYGRALHYGRKVTKGSNAYAQWIDENDLRLSDNILRSNASLMRCAKSLFENWPAISRLIDTGKIQPKNDDPVSIIRAYTNYKLRTVFVSKAVPNDDLSGPAVASILRIASAMLMELTAKNDIQNARRAEKILDLVMADVIRFNSGSEASLQ